MNGAMLQVISGVRRFAVATRLRKCMGFVTFAETYLLVESGKRGKRNVKDYGWKFGSIRGIIVKVHKIRDKENYDNSSRWRWGPN